MPKCTNWITGTLLSLCTLLASPDAPAVNWLMLQGTEPEKVTHRLFRFIQPSYTQDFSDRISAGPNTGKLAAPATIAPWFDNQERLHFRRFRLGVRGRFTGELHNGFTDKMNYFFLTELAPNLFNYEAFGNRSRTVGLDHLSLTFNHIPGARIRTGLFKTPGPEEVFQGVINIDYIEFTSFIATQSLERFIKGNARQSPSGGTNFTTGTPVNRAYGFNAARDWGVLVFDEFDRGDWRLGYGFMLGRGEDIHTFNTINHTPETYTYLSAEQDLPGGKGPRKHGIKYYAWHQQGERTFSSDSLEQDFDRRRFGIGVRALGNLFGSDKKQRMAVELMGAQGMIFIGPAGGVKGGALQYAAESDNTAWGITLDYGYFITPNWELDLRWDRMDRLADTDGVNWTSGDERVFTTTTLGLVHHFSPRNRLTFNYLFRDVDAPNENHPVVENVVGSIGHRMAVQWTYFF